MRSANSIPAEISSSRRAQPVRQTRNNAHRSSLLGGRSFGFRGSLGGGLDDRADQPPEIFPAITYFADAITALPRELVRHFTLLKEVDAKIFGPEEDLGKLVDAALSAPPPDRRPRTGLHHALAPSSAPMSAQVSHNGSAVNGHGDSLLPAGDAGEIYNAAHEPADIHRRQLFQHCAYTMQNMLLSLDEKNHVISTAAEALNKQLARIDECFPYIELEISEEARYGSLTHWAYPENRTSKSGSGGASRRDLASVNHLSAAAQNLVDEAAARSDARKQALLAKKSNNRNQQLESDFEEHENRLKELNKKPHGNSKVRKAADTTSSVGLGITNGGGANGNPAKRRKVEKGTNGDIVMERAMSGVFSSNGMATKKVASPRETPVPEPKKRSRAPAATNGQNSRKRNSTVTSTAMSPSIASSPIRSTFPDFKLQHGRGSPPPLNGARPASSRARQNSTQSLIDGIRPRSELPPSSKAITNSNDMPDLAAAATVTGRSIPEVKATMSESATNTKGEHMLEDVKPADPNVVGAVVVGNRKDSTAKREDTETNGDIVHPIQATTITTTKSGRASKPSTPAMPSFPEPLRSRSQRSALETSSSHNKRSHKKGAGAAAQLLAQQNFGNDDATDSVQGDDEDDGDADPDELRYCFCNGVSYGEMVGCDAPNCEREWFHLDCVGLKVAPKGNAKWYCNDCKDRMKKGRFNGR